MKRKYLYVFILAFIETLALALLTFVASGHIDAGLPYVASGFTAMLLAIPFHILGKRNTCLYYGSILLNLISSAGFCAIYYTETNQSPALTELLFAIIGVEILLGLTVALLILFQKQAALIGVGCVLVCLGLSAYNIVKWIKIGSVLYSFGFFSTVIAFMLLIALLSLAKNPTASPMRYASFAGFGIFAVIAFVVLVIVTEGDALEGVAEGLPEIIGDTRASKKKK